MKKYVVFMILLLFLIPVATAATVTITPTKVDPGDTVSVSLKDIPDGAKFSFGISAEFDVTPDERFTFTARGLFLPFSLDSGEVGAYTKGTSLTGLSAKKGETTIRLGDSADEKGEYQITQPYSISSGTYDFLTLSGRSNSTTKNIIAELTMTGTKKGPNDGTISFILDGIESGIVTIAVSIDSSEVHSQRITIGFAPEPEVTETSSPGLETSPTPTTPTSPGSPGSPGAPPIPPGSSTTTSSFDGKASLAGTDIEGAGLLSLAVDGTSPAGWATAGRAYALTPADRAFTTPAVLSFTLPAPDTAATIALLENGVWSPVPSKVEGDLITTSVTRGGTYTLLVSSSATSAATTPATTVTTTAPATTTPASTPLTPLIPVAACAILMLLQSRRT